MPISIQIPRLGWSMEEGIFTGWLKKEGDAVKSGEPLFTLEGEKAAQDIEATENGILHIPADSPKAGTTVKVGQVIGQLLQGNESPTAVSVPSAPSQSTATNGRTDATREPSAPMEDRKQSPTAAGSQPIQGSASTQTFPVSPRARRRAAELGVDTRPLQGKGPTGRVTEADVVRAAGNQPKRVSTLSTMRRTIAERTAASFSSIPHFYLRCEIDVTALSELRQDLLPKIETETGVRLSLTDLIIRAQSRALAAYPTANAVWIDDDIVQLTSADVGLAVALSEGITIPILRSPGTGSISDLVRQRASSIASARANQLTLVQLQGSATSLSNLGTTRVDEFAAVIPPGNSTILAIGRATLRPYVVNGKLEARNTLKLCLSIDHRVLDGTPAAEFLGLICDFLENPSKLV
ncbi:MAG: 2-oxo acid dehydrogenase subunit E2 [Verrucomicrobiales bacterium]|nr:2-oxo acid dehydrogenase subunit E2 [Verrucomicrobiales bacterium]